MGTSVWVLVDALSIGVTKGQLGGFADMGPWGWFFACLLLWIVVFPLYLSKRGEYISRGAQMVSLTTDAQATKRCPFCAEEIQPAAIKCRFCGSALEPTVVLGTSTGAAALPTAASDRPPLTRLSAGRVFAKTCHLLAIGWTAFCAIGVMVGVANVSESLGHNVSGAAAVGVGIGMTLWAFSWFVPVVGLEVVALAATSLAKRIPGEDSNRREWRRAFWFSALPNAVLVIAIIGHEQ